MLLGVLTGVGGGMLRDVLVSEVPEVLRGELYASAALAGAAVVVITCCISLRRRARSLAPSSASSFGTAPSGVAGGCRWPTVPRDGGPMRGLSAVLYRKEPRSRP